jgi:hypothetical protein
MRLQLDQFLLIAYQRILKARQQRHKIVQQKILATRKDCAFELKFDLLLLMLTYSAINTFNAIFEHVVCCLLFEL